MRTIPFTIKYCGITRKDDVKASFDCGADAIGINLVPSSPRFASPPLAIQLALQAKAMGKVVVVMVDPSREEVESVVASMPVDYVQLHGDEDPRDFDGLAVPILKALPWRGESDQAVAERWRSATGIDLAGFLVDAYDEKVRGGSGKTARWDLLQPRPQVLDGVPLILAGGLSPSNLIQAMHQVLPDGVDCASGIESSPGIKDRAKMLAFFQAYQQAISN